MNKTIKLVFLFSVLLFTLGAQSQKVTTEAIFKQYLNDDNEEMAKTIAKSKDGLYSLYCQGVLSENNDEQLQLFTQFIALKPKYGLAEAYLNRGIVYALMEKHDLALIDFDQAIALNPKDSITYYFKGTSFASLEQLDSAIENYTKSLSIDPDFEMTYYMRGISYYDQKKYKEALDDFNVVLKNEPTNDGAHLLRGIIYNEMGEYKKAIEDLEEGKRLNKDNAKDADIIIADAKEKLKATTK